MIGLPVPNGWNEAQLGTIAEIDRASITPDRIRSGTQYIGLEHLDSEGHILAVQTVSNGDLASNKFIFGPHHILYGKLRPYLRKIVRPDFEGICSTDILPIRPTQIERGYLYHYLRHPRLVEYATSRCEGANLPRLSPLELEKFPIHFPTAPREQRRIADILDKADAIRRKRREALNLGESLVEVAFADLFGDMRPEASRWPVFRMTELLSAPPNYGSMEVPVDERNDTARWLDLRVANIQDGKLDLTSRKYVAILPEMLHRHEVLEGDLLLARAIGSPEHLGKCIIARPNGEPWAFDSHLMRVRFRRDVVDPEFMHGYLTGHAGRQEFLKHSRRSAVQYNINTKELAEIRVPVPPRQLQATFLRQVQQIRRIEASQHLATAGVDDLFKSLVHRAFCGEL